MNSWKNLKKPILALAPMAGYTDSVFRLLCLKNRADLVYTEMISAEGLARQNKKTLKMLEFLPGEKDVVVQLFGTNPEAFGKAAKYIDNLSKKTRSHRPFGARDDIKPIMGIDVNFGCPAKKVFHTGAGAALMNNKKLAREIVEAVLKNTKLPVSIKIRAQVKNTTAEEFVEYLKDLPIAMVMVHGRTLAQGFAGEINYETIKNVKKLLPKVIVLGNGGINSAADIKNMLEKTGCDGVGLARGSVGNPWLFSLKEKPKWSAIKKMMVEHAQLFLKQNEDLAPLRKQFVHYVKGLSNASELRQKLIKVKTLKELKKALL
jgi:nifR3 family TIM-barrel protein